MVGNSCSAAGNNTSAIVWFFDRDVAVAANLRAASKPELDAEQPSMAAVRDTGSSSFQRAGVGRRKDQVAAVTIHGETRTLPERPLPETGASGDIPSLNVAATSHQQHIAKIIASR